MTQSRLRAAVSTWASRRSSGAKMLFWMTIALMPLGLIALFASIQSAQNKQSQHVAEARIIASAQARQVEIVILRIANIIRPAAASANIDGGRCETLVVSARSALHDEIPVALFADDGRRLCASPGGAAITAAPHQRVSVALALRDRPASLRISAAAADGAYAVADIPAAVLRSAIDRDDPRQSLTLAQGPTALTLAAGSTRGLARLLTVRAPIAGGQAVLIASGVASGVSAIEILLIIMPVLMWVGAAWIAWAVANELLLRPLGQLQRAVDEAGRTGVPKLPRMSSPAIEIRTLGDAFVTATAELAQREIALENAFQDQVKLTREVHHRVKNNLQVVASLINLHARGAAGEVAAAYASIQRRVDALAIVHRNHFAELEDNRGVALRALVAELTGNLRATAPAGATELSIGLDMIPAHISQDVAVPVAFLLTEVIELVMTCAPRGRIDIALSAGEKPDRAILAIVAPGVADEDCRDHPARERFDRILLGLARQLRAPLEIDQAAGRYAISIAVVPEFAAR